MILSQSVLAQISVYWAHLFFIPSTIIKKLNSLMATFIWGGAVEKKKYLTKLDNITLPKKMGGWSLMNLRIFGSALLCKTLLRAVFGESLWCKAIKMKYMGNKDIHFWYRNDFMWQSNGSMIWRSFQKILPVFKRSIIWKLNTGNNILIGSDAIMGVEMESPFPPPLLALLHQKGLFY